MCLLKYIILLFQFIFFNIVEYMSSALKIPFCEKLLIYGSPEKIREKFSKISFTKAV